MANYNKDTDYQALINKAANAGDFAAAAQYEQLRNQKIADLNAQGTNTYGAIATNNYSKYLNPAPKDNNFNGSANNIYVHDGQQAAIQAQMNQNSKKWWDAYNSGNQSLMNTLEQANKMLGAQLGEGVTFDSHTGTWGGVANMPTSVKTGLASTAPTYQAPTTPKPTYQSAYNAKIDELINQLINRQPFTYNPETDPLYQQYREQYNREGNRAMNDTLAAAAINAGGMNSYAVTAAQQANDYYSAQLADKIPELYQLAYSMYMDDYDTAAKNIALMQDVEQTKYNRYRDEVDDYYADRDFDYSKYRDDVADYQWETNYNYGVERDNIADKRYTSETAYNRAMDMLLQGIMPDGDLLSDANITTAEASIIKDMNAPANDDNKPPNPPGKTWQQVLQEQLGGKVMTQEQWDSFLQSNPNITSEMLRSNGFSVYAGGVMSKDPVLNLDIGPVSDSLIVEISNYGGIIEKDEQLVWANGWNKNNYQEKLKRERAKPLYQFTDAMNYLKMLNPDT